MTWWVHPGGWRARHRAYQPNARRPDRLRCTGCRCWMPEHQVCASCVVCRLCAKGPWRVCAARHPQCGPFCPRCYASHNVVRCLYRKPDELLSTARPARQLGPDTVDACSIEPCAVRERWDMRGAALAWVDEGGGCFLAELPGACADGPHGELCAGASEFPRACTAAFENPFERPPRCARWRARWCTRKK